jgi:hypothetical protein
MDEGQIFINKAASNALDISLQIVALPLLSHIQNYL